MIITQNVFRAGPKPVRSISPIYLQETSLYYSG